MQDGIVAAAVQMNSGLNKQANLEKAAALVQSAAQQGAQLVVLPELFTAMGNFSGVLAAAEPVPGPTSRFLADLAARWGIYLVAGSLGEKASVPGRAYNVSLTFGPDGRLLSCYRKIHLFDVDLPGRVSVQESQHLLPGAEIVVTPTELAQLGHAICYDLRFPELFRALAERGVEVLVIPAAFTRTTGRDHWEVLLRARAIENQAFVVAANQCGAHSPQLTSYGHSLILDPWGRTLAEGSAEGEEVILATLKRSVLEEIRQNLPALRHRRLPWASSGGC